MIVFKLNQMHITFSRLIKTLAGLHNFIIHKQGSKAMNDFDLEQADKRIAKQDRNYRNAYDSTRDIEQADEMGENIPTNEFLFRKYSK